MKLNLQPKTTYGLIGGILLIAFELGLFVTKADLEHMETIMYQTFATRQETEAKLNNIDHKIDKLMELMINEKK